MKVLNLKILMKQKHLFSTTIILPFVKQFIFLKFYSNRKYSIVEWDDVKDDVAEQIEICKNGTIITVDENKTKKQPVTVYGETT
jgi:hypothetical protein